MARRATAFAAVLNVFFILAASVTAVPMAGYDGLSSLEPRQVTSGYWMESIKRQGTVAFGSDPSYKVFRNVKDYGAVGDGNTDDTAAINKAVSDGNRCGQGCDSSTITPAIVYFPAGKYKISSPIIMYYYTQIIGDATNPPMITAQGFSGLAMFDADPYIPGGYGAQWYTNQNNFFRQMRNLVIDMTQMSQTDGATESNGIHWQVAQATSLQNIVFNMKTDGSNQRGLMTENGSGGFMSNLTFNGGNVCMYIGSQQFTTKDITLNNCDTGILIIWDWLWTFSGFSFNNVKTGLNISSLSQPGNVNQTVGSALLMDSKFVGTNVGISTAYSVNSQPKTGGTFMIHNVDFSGAQTAVAAIDGTALLKGGSVVDDWTQGDAYLAPAASKKLKRTAIPAAVEDDDTCGQGVATVTETVVVSPIAASLNSATFGPNTGSMLNTPTSGISATSGPSSISPVGISSSVATSSTTGVSTSTFSSPSNGNSSPSLSDTSNSAVTASKASTCSTSATIPVATSVQQQMTKVSIPSNLLNTDGTVFSRIKPQYQNVSVSSFISVKDGGAKGDGTTDDTAAIQKVLDSATAGQIVYFDHGAYLITGTVNVPQNIKITGEIWPVIMISGQTFSDPNNPVPAFRVGQPGDQGSVEISDLIFETRGPAPGAIMVEWNLQDAYQGASGVWDTHFRIGGTAGTLLQQDTCGNFTEGGVFKQECAGSFLNMHITQQANAYLENVWFWTADHELDQTGHNETIIFNGRGLLVESQGPTWLWGTASEHSVLYNYQISNAKNVFMGTIQTETAYFQSKPDALNGGFTPNAAYSDPDFSDCTDELCKKTWGLRIIDSSDIYMFGGGLYSFFEDYDQTCLDTESCQANMIDIQCSNNINLYTLTTKASTNMINVDGQPVVFQKDHTNGFGSTVAVFEL